MKNFRQVLEGVDVISENLSKSSKELAKEIDTAAKKESGGDKADYQAVAKFISQGKLNDAKKIIAKLDTVVLEDLITFIMGHEDVFKAMYPRARPGQYAASFARKESVEEGKLPPALQAYQDKKNGKKPDDVEEEMSPADKAKRLKMIRQAVEKMNKSNMERAKKDALKMMKDSGMFDEDVELQEIRKAPQIKHLNIYGSEISGLRFGGKYYMAMAIDMRGKLMYKVIDEFGSIETVDLKTFAKRFG